MNNKQAEAVAGIAIVGGIAYLSFVNWNAAVIVLLLIIVIKLGNIGGKPRA